MRRRRRLTGQKKTWITGRCACGGVPTPANGCWKYELTVLKYDDALRAQIKVHGPDGEKGMKSIVSQMADTLDFHYTEPID